MKLSLRRLLAGLALTVSLHGVADAQTPPEVKNLLQEVSDKLSQILKLLNAAPATAQVRVPPPPQLTPALARAAKLLASGWDDIGVMRMHAEDAGINRVLIDWSGPAAVVAVRVVAHAKTRNLLAPLLKDFAKAYSGGIGEDMKKVMAELGIR